MKSLSKKSIPFTVDFRLCPCTSKFLKHEFGKLGSFNPSGSHDGSGYDKIKNTIWPFASLVLWPKRRTPWTDSSLKLPVHEATCHKFAVLHVLKAIILPSTI